MQDISQISLYMCLKHILPTGKVVWQEQGDMEGYKPEPR